MLQFRQSRWLAPYIALNTGMRARAANKFEEQFFKDMNNSVFGILFIIFSEKKNIFAKKKFANFIFMS